MANELTLPQMLNANKVKTKFENLLGKNAASFISSILSIYNENDRLRKCTPTSILTAAAKAARWKLPIESQLGFAYVIPYGNVAQFQIGYKGLIQLAMRSGQYLTLNSDAVCEGQIKEIDFVTGKIIRGEKISDKVVGYVAYMELLNGFSKTIYMSRADVEKHAQTFSQNYRSSNSVWAKNFDAMGKKTVLKKLLSTYAPMSIEMQDGALSSALRADQDIAVYDPKPDDVMEFDTIDIETGEILSEETTNQTPA